MNDKLQKLYNLYLENGILTEATSFETFSQANANQVDALYNLGKEKGLFISTDLGSFKNAWSQPDEISEEVKVGFAEDPVRAAVKKKEDTESVSEDGLSESPISDEQAELMQSLSGSGFETLSTEEIKESFKPTPNVSDEDRYGYIDSDLIDLYHPDKATRRTNQRQYIQHRRSNIPSLNSLMRRGMGAVQAQDEYRKYNQNLEQKIKAFTDYEKTIDEFIDHPTFNDVLAGAKPFVNMPSGFYEMMATPENERDGEKMMLIESIYNSRVEDADRKQKKEAGYVEVNGVYMDPNNFDLGYGFDAALNTLNFTGGREPMSEDGMSLRNESAMKSILENKFKQYGFSVSEDVPGSDYITITGPDGSSKQFNLEKKGTVARMVSNNIKSFINSSYNNADFAADEKARQAGVKVSDVDIVGIESLTPYELMFGRSKYVTRETEKLLDDQKKIEKIGTGIKKSIQERESLENRIINLKIDNAYGTDSDGNIVFFDGAVQDVYDRLTRQSKSKTHELQMLSEAGSKVERDFNKKADVLKKYQGERALMLSNMWDIEDVPGFTVDEFMRGFGGMVAGYIGKGHDLYSNINNLFYDETDEEYITDKERKNYKQGLALTREMRGMSDMDPETQRAIRESGGIVTEGLFGLVGSLPAMMTGPLAIPSFAAMSMDAVEAEMAKIPEFANISENEKLLLTVPLGVTVGVLERFGFRNALNNSSLISRLTIKGLKKLGAQNLAKEGTKKTFQEIIESSALSTMKKAGILVASSAAAEFETGAFQELAEVYGKEIYDAAKGANFFEQAVDFQKIKGITDVGELLSWDLAKQVLRAGAAEAIGGFVMGMPNGISRAVVGERLPQISNEAFDLFRLLNNEKNVEKTIAGQKANWYAKVGVKENPKTGEKYTKKDIDDMFNLYEGIIGQSREIKEEYGPEYQKVILQKLIQRKQLEEEVGKYDKSTTKEQQRKIEVINEDIAELTSRAEKKLEKDRETYEQAKKDGFKGDFQSFMVGKNMADKVSRSMQREDAVEQAEEEAVPLPIVDLTHSQFTKYKTDLEDGKLSEDIRDGILSRVIDKEQNDLELTPFQQQVKDLNESRYKEIVTLKENKVIRDEQKRKERVEKATRAPEVEVDIAKEVELTPEEQEAELLRQQIEEQEVSPTTPEEGAKFRLKKDEQIVYHGSPTKIEGGKIKRGSSGAIFLTPQREYAEVYTGTQGQGEITETIITEAKKSKLFDLRNKEHVERLRQGFLNNNEELEIEYESEEDALRDYENAIRSMKSSAENRDGVNDWASGGQWMDAMENAGFEGALFSERPGVISYALFDDEVDIKQPPAEGPQFRTKKVQEKVAKETADEVQDIVDEMNKMESGNVGTNLDTTEEGVTINTQELNERTDNELPTITNLQIIDGIPTIFTISDQLTTGSVVNPQTGNTIDNLRGGLGFTGTEGNQNAAWANTTEKEATDIINKAFKTYEQNKEVFHKWWKANPEFSGHIPMSVVKMGEGSILSNEATFRVLRDNLTKIPVKNRKNAVKLLRKSILDKIKKRQDTIKSGVSEKTGKPLKDLTIKNYKKEITGHKETLKTLAKVNPKSIDDIVSQEFIETLSLPARRTLIEQITFGQPNRAGERKAPSKSDKAVPAALIEGMLKESLELVHLGPITDLITEPQLKDVPQRSIIALQAIEIGGFNAQTNELTEITLDESILNTKHPNYAFGTKGKTIGIVENPISVVRAYPQAFANAMSGLVKVEKKAKKMTKDKFKRLTKKEQETAPKPGELDVASVGTILTETLGVQNGLPNEEFVGAIASNDITREQQFLAFMNQSFPGVVISTDQETFDNVMKSEGIDKKFVGGRVVYGVTVDGDIYINPQVHNTESELYNTAIHEMGHIWQTWLQTTPKGQKIYKRGVELVKQTEEYQRQLEVFDGDKDKAAHEAMAVLIGNKGESIAEASTLKTKFKEWLLSMWKYIQSKFRRSKNVKVSELQDMNLDEFLGMALADIFSGEPVRGKDARSLTKLKNPEAAFSVEQDMNKVIVYGRNNGFSDAAIKIYLQKQGYTVSEIKEALTIERDLFENSFPAAFANVPGGVKEGMAMYKRTLQKIKAFKRKENPSLKEIQEQAQVFLKRDKTFKTYNETLQQGLLIALNANLDINQSSQVAEDIRKMREIVKQRRKGAKELSNLQTQLRMFVRKNFPRTQWDSKEVTQIIREVTDAKFYKDFESLAVKPDNDIRMVMDRVSKMIMQKRVDNAIKQINKKLLIKVAKTESGRKKGVNFLPEAVERIQKIREDLAINPVDYMKIEKLQAKLIKAIRLNKKEEIEKTEKQLSELKATAESISKKIETLRSEYDKLESKDEMTDKDAARMQDIDTAILYNEALLMENDNPNKADTLSQVQGLLKNMLTLEREAYNDVIRQAKERYNKLKSEFLEDISGVKVDYNDKESKREGRREISEKTNKKNNRPKVVKFWESIVMDWAKTIFLRTDDIGNLVSRISHGYGEMFGGKSAELITERLNDSRFEYYEGVDQMFEELKEKAIEVFGKNYVRVSERNQRRTEEIILDRKKYNELIKKQEAATEKADKRNIEEQIKGIVEYYSQNEMYYLYNQYKDPANHPGFVTKYDDKGFDSKDIMAQMDEKLDPKVREWADWQVNEFFPSVYQRYNEVYKKIYRTNMPWNSNYAGRLVREGAEEQIDMMSLTSNQYRSVVGSDSTKVRIQNKRAISTVSGDNMLQQYIDEMEYFRAYAENMRDISKMYTDELVKEAIETTTSPRTYNILKEQLDKIINRSKARLGSDSAVFNVTTSMFAMSKLGLNPTVMLKQMTSAFAFADYIGYTNWSKYAYQEMKKGVGKYNKTWQEMWDNSAQIRSRYDRDQFATVLESYTPSKADDILGGKTFIEDKFGIQMSKSRADEVRNFFMWMVKTGDMGGVMGSIPNYAYYKDLYKKKNPKATEQQAIDFAIRKTVPQIKSTQQSSDLQDKDHFSTGSALLRTFSLFTSSPRALLRKEAYSIRQLYRKLYKLAVTMDPKEAAKAGKGSVRDNLRTFITYHMLIPMVFQYVGLGFPGLAQDWDEDDTEQMFLAALLGNINSVFLIGDLIALAKDVYLEVPWAGRLRNIPIFMEMGDLGESMVKYKKAKKQETKDKYYWKIMFGLANLTGIPAVQTDRIIENVSEMYKGEADGPGDLFLRIFNFSPYVREGSSKKKKGVKVKGVEGIEEVGGGVESIEKL